MEACSLRHTGRVKAVGRIRLGILDAARTLSQPRRSGLRSTMLPHYTLIGRPRDLVQPPQLSGCHTKALAWPGSGVLGALGAF